LPDALKRDIDLALDRGARVLARTSKRNAPKAFSTLSNSIQSKKIGPLRYMVSAGVNYAVDVHEGRKPGAMPPVAHIEDWIRIKHITPLNEAISERDLAWMIAKSIEEHGTKAQPFMSDAAKSESHNIRQVINAGIHSALNKAAHP